jgi:DNA-binding NarL/FixJ family response regulator
MLHLAGAARCSPARVALTTAVAEMERARGRMRNERPEAALNMWRELVAGRWTLVESLEHDGRRFIVAMANPPEAVALRQLSERENVLIRLLAEGRSGSDISATLGVSRSAVSQGIRAILMKLRQPSVAALVGVVNDLNRGRQASALSPDDLGAWAVEAGPAAAPGLQRLSPGEREVARYLLDGLTTAHIAELRGSAYRTVANQIASIYEKVGAQSRADLGRKLRHGPAARS